ncbi:hypothetical protein JW998_11005, partial [candidate division KSB1 bacterium]|nr:hypothetical protein [candidate division KSB1 bacterium]
TEAGGHRCVINLPDLRPEDIDAFCERAFRAFHFSPGYLFYKLRQALRSPKEGWRSLVAGLKFLRYTLMTKRKEIDRIEVRQLDTPEGWRDFIRVPMGRMERLTKGLDPSLEAQLEEGDDG